VLSSQIYEVILQIRTESRRVRSTKSVGTRRNTHVTHESAFVRVSYYRWKRREGRRACL